MILENKGEALTITHDGKDYKIPEGKFEVADDALGSHIIVTASKWAGTKISILDNNTIKDVRPAIESKEPFVTLDESMAGIQEELTGGPSISENVNTDPVVSTPVEKTVVVNDTTVDPETIIEE